MTLAASAWRACAAPAFAETATLFRVFLNDGTAIVSYGEYARVGDRLVFSMPIGAVGADAGSPPLHVVNLPVSAIAIENDGAELVVSVTGEKKPKRFTTKAHGQFMP